jgi:hypothetical protein
MSQREAPRISPWIKAKTRISTVLGAFGMIARLPPVADPNVVIQPPTTGPVNETPPSVNVNVEEEGGARE